ncbi:MAG TPA: hypothetical protein VLS90_20675, partial [Thermodesulfobacteriota bacterium]|nr:hypothetical protein [Thermodesulfobacteriota bacterium]
MRKPFKYILIFLVVLLVLCAALVAVVAWALNTSQGTRALFTIVSILTPIGIHADEISGTLRDDLTLRGLRLALPQGVFTAKVFRLRWEPGEIWNRKLIIHEISSQGVLLKDQRPASKDPFSLRWPSTPLWLPRFEGRVNSITLQDAVYRREPPGHGPESGNIVLKTVSARMDWDGQTLSVSDFSAAGPSLRASGGVKLGIGRPELLLDLRAVSAREYAGFDSLLIKAGVAAGKQDGEAQGNLALAAGRNHSERLHVESLLRISPKSLMFSDLKATLVGRKGLLRGEGEIVFGPNPALRARTEILNLNLAPELGRDTDISGTMEVDGTQKEYKGRLSITNASKGWEQGRASAAFRGDLNGLELRNIQAELLDGLSSGVLSISWQKGIVLSGALQGRRLNPGVLHGDIKGRINADAEGKFFLQEGKPRGELKALLLPSRIQEREISGEFRGELKNDLLHIAFLGLRGKGFQLQARGVLQQKLSIEGKIADFSALVPGSSGRLAGAGWLRYADRKLAGEWTADGSDISVREVNVKTLRANFSLNDSPKKSEYSFRGQLEGGAIQAGPVPIDSATLLLDGTTSSHAGTITIYSREGNIAAEAAGSYNGETWRGIIQKLRVTEPAAEWRLEKPVPLMASPKKLQIEPVLLKSTAGELVDAKADL